MWHLQFSVFNSYCFFPKLKSEHVKYMYNSKRYCFFNPKAFSTIARIKAKTREVHLGGDDHKNGTFNLHYLFTRFP